MSVRRAPSAVRDFLSGAFLGNRMPYLDDIWYVSGARAEEIAIGSRRVGTSIPTCAFRGCHRLTTLYLSNPEWVGFYSDQTLS